MTLRPAEPGRRVATGHIRVDARRAVAKLREYQLADKTSWILEAIRAGVAAGAKSIALRGDANDIWLDWHGATLPDEVLAALLDELVSPQAEAGQERRLLATAVNTALGLEPSFVDVYTIGADRAAKRARYRPELLEASDEPESALGLAVRLESVATPGGSPAPGLRVHMRRPLRSVTLHYVFSGLPELALARRDCTELTTPLLINGEAVRAAPNAVRAPLGGGVRGFVAFANRGVGDRRASFEIAERGVILSRYQLASLLPISVFVDADRLPTNASRSEVRRDAHPVSTAERSVDEASSRLIAALARAIGAKGEGLALDDPLRMTALAAIADPDGDLRRPSPLLGALADLPLLRDATGVARAVRHEWSGAVYRGRRPYAAELERWLGGVLWLPAEDPASAFLYPRAGGRQAKRIARAARKELAAERRFLAHLERPPELPPSPRGVRASIGTVAPGSQLTGILAAAKQDGIAGEVRILGAGSHGHLVVLYRGRAIEEIEISSAIAFEAVVTSPLISPAPGYRRVARDKAYLELELATFAQVIATIEAYLAANPHLPGDDLVRPAVLFAWKAGLVRGGVGPLDELPAWPTLADGLRSTAWLRAHKAIGTIPRTLERDVTVAHPMIVASDLEHLHLSSMLAPTTRTIRYDGNRRGHQNRSIAAALRAALGHSDPDVAVLPFSGTNIEGAIAWGPNLAPDVIVHHVGVRIGQITPRDRLWPSLLWVEAADAVPDAEWSSRSSLGSADDLSVQSVETAIARALATALLGEENSLDVAVSPTSPLGRAFIAKLGDVAEFRATLFGAELAERLLEAPLVPTIDGGWKSVQDLKRSFNDAIPYVAASSGDPSPDWPAIWGSRATAAVFGKLAGRTVFDGTKELAARTLARQRERRLEVHRRKPTRALTWPRAAAALAAGEATGFVSLGHGDGIRYSVFVEDRPFCEGTIRSKWGLEVVVSGPESLANETFDGLTAAAEIRIVKACEAALGALLVAIADDSPPLLRIAGRARDLLSAWLEISSRHNDALTGLRRRPLFPTVQGGMASVLDASRGLTRIADFDGVWQAALDGKPVDLDQPILRVAREDGGLAAIVSALAPVASFDATREVRTLQLTRSIARGILLAPAVSADPSLKRTLSALAEHRIGAGEIALVDAEQSTLDLYEGGDKIASLTMPTFPSFHAAIEAPDAVAEHRRGRLDKAEIENALTAAAIRLLDLVVAEAAPPEWLARRIARALLAGEQATGTITALAVFATTADTLVSYDEILDQAKRYGEVWYTSAGSRKRPLDDERIALALDLGELDQLSNARYFRADRELELDDLARGNLARPRVTELVLGPAEKRGALTVDVLSAGGVTGSIAPLAAASGGLRGLYVYREGLYLGRHDDPCPWPTVALLDDPSLTCNRTCEAPEENAAWKRLVERVKSRSKSVISSLVAPPDDALVSRRVAISAGAHVIRGRVWLAAPEPRGVAIELASGNGVFAPTARAGGAEAALPLGGRLLSYPPLQDALAPSLQTPLSGLYGHLLRQARARWGKGTDDLVSAHLAIGVALHAISPAHVGAALFPCVESGTLPANALANFLNPATQVVFAAPGDAPGDASSTAIVVHDDGSILSATLRALRSAAAYPLESPLLAVSSDTAEAARPPMIERPAASDKSDEGQADSDDPLEADASGAADQPPAPVLLAHLRRRFAELDLEAGSGALANALIDRAEIQRVDAALAQDATDPATALALDAIVLHYATLVNALTNITDARAAATIERVLARLAAPRSTEV